MKSNTLLAVALSMGVFLIWQYFVMGPYYKKHPPPQAQNAAAKAAPAGPGLPAAPDAGDSAPVQKDKLVEMEFGQNRVSFNLYGASVHQWWIQEKDLPGKWTSLVPEPAPAARPLSTFPAVAFSIERKGNAVIFKGKRPDGLLIQKEYRISPDSYLHEISMSLRNPGASSLSAQYALGWGPGIQAGDQSFDPKSGKQSKDLNPERVVAFGPPRVIRFKKDAVAQGAYRWWGLDGHYFLAAFFNEDAGRTVSLDIHKYDGHMQVQAREEASLAPSQEIRQTTKFYLGPKGYNHLAGLGLDLEKAVDFGFFGSIGKVILKSLYFFHDLTKNYGWAIILLTLAIQVLLLPLTMKSFNYSLKMKSLQPQMKRIQEQFKNDRSRLNLEMLQLYQRHGLRFMGLEGCLPVLVQIPIFLALYSTLRGAYKLRHAPWIGWVRDLSVHDPYFILPALMGGAMWGQQKMSMASMDPAQARMMMFMPVIMIFFFLRMPAGLVLYWTTSSLVSFIIQLYMSRKSQVSGRALT